MLNQRPQSGAADRRLSCPRERPGAPSHAILLWHAELVKGDAAQKQFPHMVNPYHVVTEQLHLFRCIAYARCTWTKTYASGRCKEVFLCPHADCHCPGVHEWRVSGGCSAEGRFPPLQHDDQSTDAHTQNSMSPLRCTGPHADTSSRICRHGTACVTKKLQYFNVLFQPPTGTAGQQDSRGYPVSHHSAGPARPLLLAPLQAHGQHLPHPLVQHCAMCHVRSSAIGLQRHSSPLTDDEISSLTSQRCSQGVDSAMYLLATCRCTGTSSQQMCSWT